MSVLRWVRNLLGVGKKRRIVIDDSGRPDAAGNVARSHRRSHIDKRADWGQGKPPPGL